MVCKYCGASKFKETYNHLISERVLECEYCGTQEHMPYNKKELPICVPIHKYDNHLTNHIDYYTSSTGMGGYSPSVGTGDRISYI